MSDVESLTRLNVSDDDNSPPVEIRPKNRHWKIAVASSVVLASIGALAYVSGGMRLQKAGLSLVVGLATADDFNGDPCADRPTIRLESVKHSNLGNSGPDEGEEGIIYKASTLNEGSWDDKEIEIHVHALTDYKAPWPKANGINGNFGVVNVASGKEVTIRVHAAIVEDGEAKEVKLGKSAFTFFDLDAGLDSTKSVEFVKVKNNFDAYWLTNETEVVVAKDEKHMYTTFTATKRGTGEDNPFKPILLTPLQKNRAVTVQYDDIEEFQMDIGASEGKTVRVFQFTLRPALTCAKTTLTDGTAVAADDPKAPIQLVRTRVTPELGSKLAKPKKSGTWALRPQLMCFMTLVPFVGNWLL